MRVPRGYFGMGRGGQGRPITQGPRTQGQTTHVHPYDHTAHERITTRMVSKRPQGDSHTPHTPKGASQEPTPDELRSPEAFADRLRRAIAMRGITQNELGRRLDVSQANVSAWTNAANMPSGPVMLRLPSVLDVNASWLLEGRGQPYRTDPTAPRKDQVFFAGAESAMAELEREVEEAFGRVRGRIEAAKASVTSRGQAAANDVDATDKNASVTRRTTKRAVGEKGWMD
jgi:transcriptional regulator with XRE-family HTH domain